MAESIDELRKRLFAEMETMSREDMIRELEEAGFVIRYDLDGGGILNSDGTPFEWRDRV